MCLKNLYKYSECESKKNYKILINFFIINNQEMELIFFLNYNKNLINFCVINNQEMVFKNKF